MPTDTQVTSLVINRLSKSQYDSIQSKSNTELYLVPDEIDSVPTYQSTNVVSSGGVYGALQTKAEDSQVVKLSGNQSIAGTKTFTAEVKMNAGGTSDICSGVTCAFKTNMAQATNLVTHNILTGGTDSTTPITFYKYGAVTSAAPSTLTQLAKIDTDGNIYEGTTKLSDKYQDTLVSGTNIKTINNESILGSGNITIQGGGGDANVIESISVNNVAQTVTNKNVDITIPTKVSDLQNDSGYTTNTGTLTGVKFNNVDATVSSGVASITASIPSAPGTLNTTATTAQSTSASEALSGNITLHKVAKTGTYSDLIGTPTIPSAPGTLVTNATTAQTASSGEAMSGTITLHKVAKTGTYSDLIGTPTIPTVNNSTITIQKGGSTVDTFTTNASSAKSINIPNELPSYTSSNNGQVLGVVNGALSWISTATVSSGSASPSGGNNGDIYLQI